MSRPCTISPDEYGDQNYDEQSLIYFADGVLTDDYHNIIEDVDDMVGVDSLTKFGEYEADTVFVRNDEDECDYEICRDERNFHDIYPEE